jgi:hypothetical protein
VIDLRLSPAERHHAKRWQRARLGPRRQRISQGSVHDIAQAYSALRRTLLDLSEEIIINGHGCAHNDTHINA